MEFSLRFNRKWDRAQGVAAGCKLRIRERIIAHRSCTETRPNAGVTGAIDEFDSLEVVQLGILKILFRKVQHT